MDRRALVALVIATPFPFRFSRAQGPSLRRIGVLVLGDEYAAGKALIAAFQARLLQLGWTAEQNIRIDVRWGGGALSTAAQDLVQSGPDVIVAQGIEGIAAVTQLTRAIPTLFVQVSDPVGAGLVSSLSRPGGNVTGVANFPPSIAGDRVRVLKEFVPGIADCFSYTTATTRRRPPSCARPRQRPRHSVWSTSGWARATRTNSRRRFASLRRLRMVPSSSFAAPTQ